MRMDKYRRMMVTYGGHKGTATVAAVLDGIPDVLMSLTGAQLGVVMSAVNAAYHRGRASCQAEVIDGDAVWIAPLGRLIELADIAVIPETQREAGI